MELFTNIERWAREWPDRPAHIGVNTQGAREIIIAGPNVSIGYIGRPDLNAAAFFMVRGQRAYRTGDIGHFDEKGLLHFRGRRDGQIKLHGYRIELADIESNLLALPNVREAVVMPVERGGGGAVARRLPDTEHRCTACGDGDQHSVPSARGTHEQTARLHAAPIDPFRVHVATHGER